MTHLDLLELYYIKTSLLWPILYSFPLGLADNYTRERKSHVVYVPSTSVQPFFYLFLNLLRLKKTKKNKKRKKGKKETAKNCRTYSNQYPPCLPHMSFQWKSKPYQLDFPFHTKTIGIIGFTYPYPFRITNYMVLEYNELHFFLALF